MTDARFKLITQKHGFHPINNKPLFNCFLNEGTPLRSPSEHRFDQHAHI